MVSINAGHHGARGTRLQRYQSKVEKMEKKSEKMSQLWLSITDLVQVHDNAPLYAN